MCLHLNILRKLLRVTYTVVPGPIQDRGPPWIPGPPIPSSHSPWDSRHELSSMWPLSIVILNDCRHAWIERAAVMKSSHYKWRRFALKTAKTGIMNVVGAAECWVAIPRSAAQTPTLGDWRLKPPTFEEWRHKNTGFWWPPGVPLHQEYLKNFNFHFIFFVVLIFFVFLVFISEWPQYLNQLPRSEVLIRSWERDDRHSVGFRISCLKYGILKEALTFQKL